VSDGRRAERSRATSTATERRDVSEADDVVSERSGVGEANRHLYPKERFRSSRVPRVPQTLPGRDTEVYTSEPFAPSSPLPFFQAPSALLLSRIPVTTVGVVPWRLLRRDDLLDLPRRTVHRPTHPPQGRRRQRLSPSPDIAQGRRRPTAPLWGGRPSTPAGGPQGRRAESSR